jgi:metal-dependent amidase/aminoacylase/carboxypeptidase family protein
MWFSNRVRSAQAGNRKVILLFQPAEEDGSGAQKVFSDTKFAAFNPDYVLPYIIYLDIQKIRL